MVCMAAQRMAELGCFGSSLAYSRNRGRAQWLYGRDVMDLREAVGVRHKVRDHGPSS